MGRHLYTVNVPMRSLSNAIDFSVYLFRIDTYASQKSGYKQINLRFVQLAFSKCNPYAHTVCFCFATLQKIVVDDHADNKKYQFTVYGNKSAVKVKPISHVRDCVPPTFITLIDIGNIP